MIAVDGGDVVILYLRLAHIFGPLSGGINYLLQLRSLGRYQLGFSAIDSRGGVGGGLPLILHEFTGAIPIPRPSHLWLARLPLHFHSNPLSFTPQDTETIYLALSPERFRLVPTLRKTCQLVLHCLIDPLAQNRREPSIFSLTLISLSSPLGLRQTRYSTHCR